MIFVVSKETLSRIFPYIQVRPWSVVFLYGEIGSGKTTFCQSFIPYLLKKEYIVRSPTYTYYTCYDYIYHFDLYRLQSYEEFYRIGWEDIINNEKVISLIEWPWILEGKVIPDVSISFWFIWSHETYRIIEIKHHAEYWLFFKKNILYF